MSAPTMTCSFGSSDGSSCGQVGENSLIIPLARCDNEMTSNLRSLGIGLKRSAEHQTTISEVELILNRAGIFDKEDRTGTMTICPKHRRELTIDWPGRKKSTCSHPQHKGQRKQMKNFRRVNIKMSEEIFALHKASVPIGSAICAVCRVAHYKEVASMSIIKTTTNENLDVASMASTSGIADPKSIAAFDIEVETRDEENYPIYITETATSEALNLAGTASTSGIAPETVTSDEAEITSSQSSQTTASIPEEEISIWLDEKEEEHAKRNTLNEAFGDITGGRVSPLQSTLNTEWEDISSTQQKYYLRKAKEMFTAALSVIGPGQEERLWESLRREKLNESEEKIGTKRKYFDSKSDLIEALVTAHNEAQTWQTKRQILSIFANDFSRSELQEIIPDLSKWRIDQARLHATKTGKGQPISQRPIFRTRIDNVKVDHFLDFISRPELLQDVAFGTKTLKLDSGERISIPAVVRTLIPSRIIEQYMCYCKEQNFEPTGERSLYRILDVCSASMQKSLQGLDNITAEGTEAIDSLIKIIQILVELNGVEESWGKAKEKEVKEGKRYLKTDFKAHVRREENCTDHCSKYSLSDPKNKEYQSKCQHTHDIECERCQSLEQVLNEIGATIKSIPIDEEQRSRLQFDFSQCDTAIRAWKAHLLRSVKQEEAKQDAMINLDQETCLIIADWAMKFLPMKYRENMCEFFGKRGRSWHISAVVTKKHDGGYQVECFVHVFNSCTQDNYAVASIYENLLKTIKAELPLIKKAYLRSDNAGCYHNGPLLLYLASMGTRTGVTPIRYDFSDPQAGKDICDRKTAPMKAHIRRYVNENHDVVTAEDMKTAIESHGGLTGCRVSVVEIDSSKALNDANKIPGISLLYNFKYENEGLRTWKAFGIGNGKLLKYKDFQKQQSIAELEVKLPFGPRRKEPGTIKATAKGKQTAEIFGCSESACILTFKTEREAQDHMDTGKHVKELESVSLYDNVRKKWAERVTGISGAVDQPPPTPRDTQEESGQLSKSTQTREMGWALKVTKKSKRFEEKVKTFLIEKFEMGERHGNKVDPLSVSREMKLLKRDGKLFFKPEEWKTTQQIKSFFSRYSADLRQKRVGETRVDETDEALTEEDMEAWESEIQREDLRGAVYAGIEKPEHPIEVDQLNICELVQDGKLTALKIAKLKALCDALELECKGSKARKKSYIDPLEKLVNSCSCQR